MTILEKTSGAWEINGSWVIVAQGQVMAYDDRLTVSAAPDWTPPAGWFNSPIMAGDRREFGGQVWESMADNNIWTPPIAWAEVNTGE